MIKLLKTKNFIIIILLEVVFFLILGFLYDSTFFNNYVISHDYNEETYDTYGNFIESIYETMFSRFVLLMPVFFLFNLLIAWGVLLDKKFPSLNIWLSRFLYLEIIGIVVMIPSLFMLEYKEDMILFGPSILISVFLSKFFLFGARKILSTNIKIIVSLSFLTVISFIAILFAFLMSLMSASG